MHNAVKEKLKAWQQWRNGGTTDEYLKAKKATKTAIYFVKRGAQTEPFARNNNNSDKIAFLKWLKD